MFWIVVVAVVVVLLAGLWWWDRRRPGQGPSLGRSDLPADTAADVGRAIAGGPKAYDPRRRR